MKRKELDTNIGFYEKRKKILWLKEICRMVKRNHWIVWMNDEDFVELTYCLMAKHVKIDPEIVLNIMIAVYKHKRSVYNRKTNFRFNDSRKAIHEIEDCLNLPRFNRRIRDRI